MTTIHTQTSRAGVQTRNTDQARQGEKKGHKSGRKTRHEQQMKPNPNTRLETDRNQDPKHRTDRAEGP